MKAKRFVEAVMELKWSKVLDDRDVRRVYALYAEAAEHSADHVLVGFRVRGPVARIVWAVIEVIPLGPLADDDLAPGLPRGVTYEGWDCQLDHLTFSQRPTAELAQLDDAELAELDDAKPEGLEDSPAILVSYPGRVSWEELRQTSERLLGSA